MTKINDLNEITAIASSSDLPKLLDLSQKLKSIMPSDQNAKKFNVGKEFAVGTLVSVSHIFNGQKTHKKYCFLMKNKTFNVVFSDGRGGVWGAAAPQGAVCAIFFTKTCRPSPVVANVKCGPLIFLKSNSENVCLEIACFLTW